MIRRSFFFFATLLFSLLVLSCQVQDETPVATPESGFTVLSQFQKFYEAHGGERLLGEPITGACERGDGRLVQYFRRVRLDYTADEEIAIYPLGAWAFDGVATPVPAAVPESGRRRLFPATGYVVQDEFLAFYETNDGEVVLGPPISDQLDEGELRVQYFRNGRLEWHPDAPRASRVRIGALGRAHFAQGAHDVTCDVRARPADAVTAGPVDVTAAVGAPILYSEDEQMVYVTVTTPAGVPLADVRVTMTVNYRDDTFDVALGRTDEEGKVEGPLALPGFQPGHEVELTVRAQSGTSESIGITTISFQTWW